MSVSVGVYSEKKTMTTPSDILLDASDRLHRELIDKYHLFAVQLIAARGLKQPDAETVTDRSEAVPAIVRRVSVAGTPISETTALHFAVTVAQFSPALTSEALFDGQQELFRHAFPDVGSQ